MQNSSSKKKAIGFCLIAVVSSACAQTGQGSEKGGTMEYLSSHDGFSMPRVALADFKGRPLLRLRGKAVPVIYSTAWGSGMTKNPDDERPQWDKAPAYDRALPLTLDTAHRPEEVTVTLLRRSFSRDSERGNYDGPFVCHQEENAPADSMCVVSKAEDGLVRIIPTAKFQAVSGYRFMTLQARWGTDHGDQLVSWLLSLKD